MKYCVGIDLGSTTTKAVILGDGGETWREASRGIPRNLQGFNDAAAGDLIEFRVIEGAGHSAHREVALYDSYVAELRRALTGGANQ